jgi:drug/metabolite transporter (DMT)-like permease
MTASGATIAALAAAWWLLRRAGAWDTYHTPLFWPFLFASGIMIVFSTSDAPREPGWRALVWRVALAGALVAGGAALLASRNPINDIHVSDIVALAVLEALLVAAAGMATELGERYRPGKWIRTAWCTVSSMLILALIPRVLLLLR